MTNLITSEQSQEIFSQLNLCAHVLLTKAAQGAAYPSWSDEFARDEIKNAWTNKRGNSEAFLEKPFRLSDFDLLSFEQLTVFGFGRWDEDLVLIPLWIWNYIADGEELQCISGEKTIKGKGAISLDVRFGCIAWGWRYNHKAQNEP